MVRFFWYFSPIHVQAVTLVICHVFLICKLFSTLLIYMYLSKSKIPMGLLFHYWHEEDVKQVKKSNIAGIKSRILLILDHTWRCRNSCYMECTFYLETVLYPSNMYLLISKTPMSLHYYICQSKHAKQVKKSHKLKLDFRYKGPYRVGLYLWIFWVHLRPASCFLLH